ncbi:uncharacterized protein K444DRAFT_712588, partial [Hyaloscypha bicolor E]
CVSYTPRLSSYTSSSVTKFLLKPFYRTLGTKVKFLSRSCVLVAAKTRQDMTKYAGAVKWQFQMAFNMLGWIPAVSTSSAELSEAINSMYNWYRLSDVCYVYLPDVATNLGTKATEDAIRKSRWFTRGWTLQELIAPSGVIFFDSKWGDLGTKKSLETVITDITKINGEVLRDANNMGEFSVAQKMSWASERVTTRVEDIAYCLLGIFGVNMPTLYGEGDQAFGRLQEEIMKSTLDHSIFAWTETSYFGHGLLAPTPACFTNSGNIVQCKNTTASPFTSANKGINLHLRLKTFDKSILCLAVLDCYDAMVDDMKLLGIYLERQSEKSDVFRRIRGDKLGSMGRERVMLDALSYQSCCLSVHGLKESGSEVR